jgi:hypothetical protein
LSSPGSQLKQIKRNRGINKEEREREREEIMQEGRMPKTYEE